MTVRTAAPARPSPARPALSLITLLAATLAAGCNEIPALAPYVDFNPPPVGLDAATDADPVDGDRPDVDGEPPDGPMPSDEVCDGIDNDFDGVTDEGTADLPCQVGQGACLRNGMSTCEGGEAGCTAEMVEGVAERCNALDDDCDGAIDERFEGLGDACDTGVGACFVEGEIACLPDGSGAACDAVAGEPDVEICDGRDNDCDGLVDEDAVLDGSPMVEDCTLPNNVGRCRQGTRTCNAAVGTGMASWTECATIGETNELCNGEDDDCDGNDDEAFTQQYMIGDPCDLGPALPGCPEVGVFTCSEDGNRATCELPPESACDGRDDNCNGDIDEGTVCGEFVQSTCRAWLGWTVEDLGDPAEMWGRCPGVADISDTLSCNGAPVGRQPFAEVYIGGDVDAADDRLGVSWQCPDGGGNPFVEFTERACTVYLGIGPAAIAPEDGAPAWGPCPGARVGIEDDVSCTSGGQAFRPMPLALDADEDAVLSVAFRCSANNWEQILGGLAGVDPRILAAQQQATTEILIAWADSSVGGSVDWATVCAPGGDGNPATACVSSNGDGLFHTLRFTRDLDAQDRLAIGLRPLDAP